MDNTTLILLVAPIGIADIVMKVWALSSLYRAERVRGGSKLLWLAVILLINVAGWVAWFLAGRLEE